MADWLETFHEMMLSQEELDRLHRMYVEGRVSRNYMLGFFGLSEVDFNDAQQDWARRKDAEVADG